MVTSLDPESGVGSSVETSELEDNSVTDAKIASHITSKITGYSGLFSRSGETGITASTTQTQGQQPLTTEINQIVIVANANDVVTLPPAAQFIQVFIINDGANSLQIFPASGDDLEDGVDVPVNLASNSKIRFIGVDNTNWVVE